MFLCFQRLFSGELYQQSLADHHNLEVKCVILRANHLDFLQCISVFKKYIFNSPGHLFFGSVREDNWSHWICIKSSNFPSNNSCLRARANLQHCWLDRDEKQALLYIYHPMKLVLVSNTHGIPFLGFFQFFSVLKFCLYLWWFQLPVKKASIQSC